MYTDDQLSILDEQNRDAAPVHVFLRSGLRKARKDHQCCNCAAPILKNEIYQDGVLVNRDSNKIEVYKSHRYDCWEALA